MKNKKKWLQNLFRFLIGVTIFMPSIDAARRTRRTGRIAQALQPNNLIPQRQLEVRVKNQPLQIAQAKTNEVLAEKTILDTSDIKEFPALKEDRFVLPKELQKEVEKDAKKALETLEPTILEEPEKIDLQFEDADLQNFIIQMQELFNVTFLTDEAIIPLRPGAKPIKGNKISFKTQEPLTKPQVWNIFVTFLEISGFAVVPTPEPSVFRIQMLSAAQKAPLPAYIGVAADTLPDNNDIIRYVYFIENSTVDAITKIVESLKSPDAPLIALKEHKAFLLTDKSYNIRTLMNIVKELDRVTMPQAMSVLKLRNADAEEVKKLYDTLTQGGPDQQVPFRPFNTRRPPTSLFFPENTRVIAETRTNSLILLGTRDAIKKIEDFVVKYVDVELDQPYSPLHTYQLKYASAKVIADIMNNVADFGKQTKAGQVGGVRAGDKYLGRLVFVPEDETNRLIIRGDYNDYLIAKNILDKLDEQQPQVAIEILILSIELNKQKELGAQIRSKVPGPDGLLGKNVKFQTSGLRLGGGPSGIVQNPPAGNTQNLPAGPGVDRLLGNLLNLVSPSGAGNTIVSLGRDLFGVWGILAVLETITNLQVISNPFVIATNKTPAIVSIGETRRVQIGEIITQSGTGNEETLGDAKAALKVKITPQINSDGMIVIDLVVDITEFTNALATTAAAATDPSQANTRTQRVATKTIVADKEVLALGGLIRTTANNSYSKTPILGDIPIIGWLFRNQFRRQDKDNLLILLSTRIISPEKTGDVSKFTQERIKDYHGSLSEMHDPSEHRDPIHRLFFKDDPTERVVEDFIFDRSTKLPRGRRKRQRRKSSQPPENEAQTAQNAQPERPASTIIDLTSEPTRETTTTNQQPTNKPQAQTLDATENSVAQASYKKLKRRTTSLTTISPKEKGSRA